MKCSVINFYFVNWCEDKFVEVFVLIFLVENIVVVFEEDVIFVLLVGGIKEYEILLKIVEIVLIFFRSNGLFGKDDFMWCLGCVFGINNKVVFILDG